MTTRCGRITGGCYTCGSFRALRPYWSKTNRAWGEKVCPRCYKHIQLIEKSIKLGRPHGPANRMCSTCTLNFLIFLGYDYKDILE